MSDIEQRIYAITRFMLAEDPEEREKIKAELKAFGDFSRPPVDPETITRSIFLEIGVPEHLRGYEPAIYAITLIVKDRKYLDNVTHLLYPAVAKEFDNTKSGIERCIRSCVEHAWQRGNIEVLTRYFGYSTNPERGKPTNSEFLARIANVVKQRIRYDA